MLEGEVRDVFVSHASEDKTVVADPLVKLLNQSRVSTWYDTTELKVGDSLLAKIDEGLNTSRFGVVILSSQFFRKNWPRLELDGLFARVTSDNQFRILPVWHDVTVEQVRNFSPIIAGQVGVPTSLGLEHVASKVHESVFSRVDPTLPEDYAQVHSMETLRLTDMPLAHGWIEHQYFSKCIFTGPAVVAMDTGMTVKGCKFSDEAQFFPIPSGRRYSGMIGVRHTAFIDCTFDQTVGLAVPTEDWNAWKKLLGIK